MSSIELDVVCEAPGWDCVSGAEDIVRRAAGAALDRAGVRLRPGAELGVLLSDDEAVRELNRQWRGKDKPTNVLSFPAASPGALDRAPALGDVAIALETVRREADAEGKSVPDHLSHLVVHGVLHLLGYDHEVREEAERMEALEVAVLRDLGIADPYGDAALDEAASRGRMAGEP